MQVCHQPVPQADGAGWLAKLLTGLGKVGAISWDCQIRPDWAEARWASGLLGQWSIGAQVHTSGLETLDTGLGHLNLEFIQWRGEI